MSEIEKNKYDYIDTNEIDLIEVFEVLLSRKKFIIYATLLFGFLFTIYSLSLPNIYKSAAILSPVESQETSSGNLGSLGGLVGLAGINLSASSNKKHIEAIERIKSFDFFTTFFLPSIKLENLMAVYSWDPKANLITYDDDNFDNESKKWTRNVSFPRKVIPSNQESYEEFMKIMEIEIDDETSFVSISIEHKSALVAQNWIQNIVDEINRSMKEERKSEINKSIDFLNNEMLKVNFVELKQAIASLQQDQMEALMLIESSNDYVFRIIDSPYAPEEYFKPSRINIVVLGVLSGFFLSCLFIILRYFINLNKT